MGDQITLEDWLNEEIEVCDKCLRACCWHGLFMCDDFAIAGTIKKKRRDLVALGLEHSDYMVVDGESEHLYVTPKPETAGCGCTDSWETVHVEDSFANITAGFSFTQNGTYPTALGNNPES